MAGQISQRFIDDLLSRVDIGELIGERVVLKKTGSNLTGLCPFHDEKSPSFSVSREKQFYHCFGCGASGDAIRFLMEYDRLSFPEAIEQLAARQGMEVVHEDSNLSPRQREQKAQAHRQQEQGVNLLELAARWYATQLSGATAISARQYLEHRGLDASVISLFGIGFAPDGWENLKQYLHQQGVAESVQVEYGLLVQREGSDRTYDRFRNRVIFPIRDWKGRVIGFGGRVLGDEKPKYLNSPETPVFHKGRELYGLYEARQHDSRLKRLIVVEGYMDVVALAQNGIHNAVATLGTAITTDHLQRVFRLVDEVVFCFDGDSAGRRAASKALDVALPLMIDGRQARFLFLPDTEDPDSLVRKEGMASFVTRIESASPLSEFIFDQARQDVDIRQIEGRERFVTHVLMHLKRLPEGVLHSLLMAELAQRSGVDKGQLQRLAQEQPQFSGMGRTSVEKGVSQHEPRMVQESGRHHDKGRTGSRLSLSTRVLHLLLYSPALIASVPESTTWVPKDRDGKLLEELVQLLHTTSIRSIQPILARFHDTEHRERLLELAQQEPMIPENVREKELQELVQFLQRQHLQLTPREEYHALLEQSKVSALSPEQKQRLLKLLTELSHR